MVVAKSTAPIRLSDPARAAHLVEHLEVLQQRLLGVDGEREHVAAAGRDRDLALLVGQRGGVEELGEALPALDLHHQDPAAPRGQRQGQRGGDGGLAGAALAGDDVQPDAREGRVWAWRHVTTVGPGPLRLRGGRPTVRAATVAERAGTRRRRLALPVVLVAGLAVAALLLAGLHLVDQHRDYGTWAWSAASPTPALPFP